MKKITQSIVDPSADVKRIAEGVFYPDDNKLPAVRLKVELRKDEQCPTVTRLEGEQK